MRVTELDYTDKIPVCPNCYRPVSYLGFDELSKKCTCGERYKNGTLKTRVIKYKLPEIESVEIV